MIHYVEKVSSMKIGGSMPDSVTLVLLLLVELAALIPVVAMLRAIIKEQVNHITIPLVVTCSLAIWKLLELLHVTFTQLAGG